MSLIILLLGLNNYAWWGLDKNNECISTEGITPETMFNYVQTVNGGFSECKMESPEAGTAHITCKKPVLFLLYYYRSYGLCLKYRNKFKGGRWI
jgi:hypothetical protein